MMLSSALPRVKGPGLQPDGLINAGTAPALL